jgi:hypothetical protein
LIFDYLLINLYLFIPIEYDGIGIDPLIARATDFELIQLVLQTGFITPFFQISIIVVAVILRLLLLATRLNQPIAIYTPAHKFPLTFVGLFIGLIMGAISALSH